MQIIIFNGPAGTGKDTAADGLEDLLAFGTYRMKFAQPLRDALCGALGIKDKDLEDLKRRDPRVRRAMIGMSEDVFKQIYDQFFFAERAFEHLKLVQELAGGNIKFVVTDGGFGYEVGMFCDLVRKEYPESEFLVIRTHRDGYTFDGDSRHYVSFPFSDFIQTADIFAETPEMVKAQARRLAMDFWSPPRW